MISTIELQKKVIEKGLCVNCGACQGMCPYWESMEGRTFKCYDCDRTDGRCLRFCPRMDTDEDALLKQFFPDTECIDALGPVQEIYIARAKDPEIRKYSQHGGTVTALVELALKEGLMDAAVLTGRASSCKPENEKIPVGMYAGNNGCELKDCSKAAVDLHNENTSRPAYEEIEAGPEGVLVTDPAGVRACAGSSFQIPATLAVLNRALSENKYKKIGLVGTACKTLAAYKMKSVPFAENTNHAENIGLIIGLFCGWGLDWNGFKALEEKYGFENALAHCDIPPSKYHCIEFDDVKVDLDEVYPLVRQSCKYCDDMTARFADISVGGARTEKGWENDKHYNQIIVRSKKGQELIELAIKRDVLEISKAPRENLEKLAKAAASKKARNSLPRLEHKSKNCS